MRLYLDGQSKKGIGYTPDWLKIQYVDSEGKNVEMTFDIQGTIEYDKGRLGCRVKGELIPWVIFYIDEDKEVDLLEIDLEILEKQYPLKEIIEKRIPDANIEIGIYPCMDEDLTKANEDELSNCTGTLDYDDKSFEFTFITEFNGN